MRQITCAVAAVLMAAAVACSPRDRQETADNAESAAEDVSGAVREGAGEIRDEAGEARDYAFAQRNEFRSDIELRLKSIDQEIAELKADTKAGIDAARDSALVNIRAARQAVDRHLDRLESATENNWDEVKRAVNQAMDSLHEAVRRERPDARPMGGTGPS